MEVKVFQVIFEEGPYDEANKKYRYGKPKIETLKEVELTTGVPVNYYAIHTHDRGSYDRGPYYQVAFRVTDATPYDKQDVELKLDSAVYRNADHQIGNDLFYDQDNDLWYQLSRYEQNNKGEWRIIADNKKSALRVDSITAAGVFRIVAIRKGRIVKNDFCWVYVLPSSISKEEYTALLNDLIRIHEKLIVNSRSTVGVGTVQKKRSEAAHIKDEISDLKHLKSAIQAVIALPSESLEKQYYKESLEKVKRFDSRVIRDYIKNAGVGKIRSIKYNNDLDTYYQNSLSFNMGKQMLRNAHLYQIYAYVKNEDRAHTGNVSGMLLYARTTEEIEPCLSVPIGGNQISVRSLDLNRPFAEIADSLDRIAYESFGESLKRIA